MVKRIFIIHGWEGHPNEGWFPWLKRELEKKNFHVQIPSMPDADEPKISKWVSFLKDQVGDVNEDTYFIGHSIGCQTILRYFESLEKNEKVGGAVLVAGFVSLKNLETDEEKEIARPWLETLIQWNKILVHTNKFVAIFFDNDPYVGMENSKVFNEKLGAKIIIEHGKGHLNEEAGVMKLPVVLTEILRIVNIEN